MTTPYILEPVATEILEDLSVPLSDAEKEQISKLSDATKSRLKTYVDALIEHYEKILDSLNVQATNVDKQHSILKPIYDDLKEKYKGILSMGVDANEEKAVKEAFPMFKEPVDLPTEFKEAAYLYRSSIKTRIEITTRIDATIEYLSKLEQIRNEL